MRNTALIALIAYLFTSNKVKTQSFSIATSRYFILFALFQVLSSFMIWSRAGFETFNLWIRLGIVYFLIVKSVNNTSRVKAICFMIILAISYLAYYSITKFAIYYIPGIRAGGFGWYENSNDLSMILVAVIPLALLIANTSRSFIKKYIFILLAIYFSFNVLFTGSRNGLLALLIVGILSLLSSEQIIKPIRLALTILLIFSVVSVGVSNVLSRSDLSGLTGDDSSEHRKEQWKAGVRMMLAKPFFGVGRGEFRYNAVDFGGIRGVQPHNTFIQVFAESGIPAGIFFTLFSVGPLFDAKKLLKHFNRNKLSKDYIITYKFLTISLAGFWVCAFFGNRYHAYILYVLVGLLVSIREIIRKHLLQNEK
ncbi:O-antigen ligase family protein [Elusimicrobiota bacterium]